MDPKQNDKSTRFDPFAAEHWSPASRAWLWATACQAVLTCGLLILAKYAEGRRWQAEASWLLLLGIVATWSLALRTIRQELVELLRYWRKASRGLLRKASESGRHLIAAPLSAGQERNIRGAMWRLRIIAAGLTLPFFVMPLVCSLVAVFLALRPGANPAWTPLALSTLLGAFIVGGYFRWAILPLPVKVSGPRHAFPRRRRPWGPGAPEAEVSPFSFGRSGLDLWRGSRGRSGGISHRGER